MWQIYSSTVFLRELDTELALSFCQCHGLALCLQESDMKVNTQDHTTWPACLSLISIASHMAIYCAWSRLALHANCSCKDLPYMHMLCKWAAYIVCMGIPIKKRSNDIDTMQPAYMWLHMQFFIYSLRITTTTAFPPST